ncbi:MAG: hypothetical protein OEZ39_01560 [Gammaproteobacteria bacterium]|nr:hypothetical protein [Gammaproteobacteria bacterium]MDH5650540.1 hypothetical protein [Gammaproteobacteria bacterium]
MAKLILTGSVGIGGKNESKDIEAVQKALNQCIKLLAPLPKLKEDGDLGKNPASSKTVAAIKAFQKKVVGMANPDGLISVDKGTHRKLNETAVPANLDLLTFPGTSFTYVKTTKTVEECIATLPAELRTDFKIVIINVIKEMHKLGFALGVLQNARAGYRTFQDQIIVRQKDPKASGAGPGESFHHYGLAVDLGVLQWIDNKGKAHSDFWLGAMDEMAGYKGFSSKIWAKRDSYCVNKAFRLRKERIHLQGVPATTSGRVWLAKCMSEAGKADSYEYKKGGINKKYKCKVKKDASWVEIGTAKELWMGIVKNVTAEQKKKIIKHFKASENIAKTINIQ